MGAYASELARKALAKGELAANYAKKAAAAGKIAAANALASAKLKAKLAAQKGKAKGKTKMVTLALKRETYAAKLADRAAKMERAIVTGSKMPAAEESEMQEDALVAAHDAAEEADVET